MKRLSVSIFAIVALLLMQCCNIKLQAANIDEATARQLGTYYLSVMSGNRVIEESQVSLVYKFMNKDQNIPAAYIFNVEKQGFVIVSGSDLWYPILGYSTEGLLDTNRMAPAFKSYFEGLCEYIVYSQNTGVELISGVQEEWDELYYQKLPELKNPKAEYWLMDAEWGQGMTSAPTYNKFCPHKTVDGYEQTAYVGCVATAMSQIMHYWKYPVEPVEGTIGYACLLDSVFYDSVEIDMSVVEYNYDLMPNRLTSTSTEEEINETAELCYHAGVSVEMGYGLMASYAWSYKVAGAMKNVFLFDDKIDYVERTDTATIDAPLLYTNEEWAEMMRIEIESGRPMYYSGYSLTGEGRDAGGHAFVCDGMHPSNGKFHFNWGWDGMANVWCDVRNNELPVYDYNFKYHQEMVRRIQPKGSNVGIDQHENLLGVAYPNPVVNEVTIPYRISNDASMSVYSVTGKLMDCMLLKSGEGNVKIDVSNYPKGVYVYKVGVKTNKFIVR